MHSTTRRWWCGANFLAPLFGISPSGEFLPVVRTGLDEGIFSNGLISAVQLLRGHPGAVFPRQGTLDDGLGGLQRGFVGLELTMLIPIPFVSRVKIVVDQYGV